MDPHQANHLLNYRLCFNPTPTFLGVTFDRTLSLFKHLSSLKAKLFPRLKALRCISASSWGPSKKFPSLFYIKLFFGLLSHTTPPVVSLSVTNFTKLERLHRAASRVITGCFLSSSYPTSLRGFFTSPTSHSDLFHSFIL